MEFQVRVGSELTPKQIELEDKYYEAVKLLKSNGFNAKLRKLFVSKETDDPACIHLV